MRRLKNLTIADKLFYSITIILTLILGLLGAFLIQRETDTLIDQTQKKINTTVKFFEESFSPIILDRNFYKVQQTIEYLDTPEFVAIDFFSKDEKLIYSFQKKDKQIADLVIVRNLRTGQKNFGFFKAYFTDKSVAEIRSARIIQFILLIVITGIILAASLYLMNRRLIVQPIERMLEFSKKLAHGNYREKLEVDRTDEMGILQNSFNDLAQSLHEYVTLIETRREEAELARKEAQEAFKVRSEFIANMSHEIRTPMNAVIGFSELLLESEENLTSDQKEKIQTIRSSAKNLLHLINSILDFSKIEAGKLNINPTLSDIRQVITDTLMIVTHEIEKKNVELTSKIDIDVPTLAYVDQIRLRQILLNLLGNAVKFTNEGSIRLSVEASNADDERATLLFKVHDSGIGIPQSKLEIIFLPFIQADSSKTRQYGGTGLGLPISKRLVELMGGEIWVESTEGKGSIFSFTIIVGLPN